MNVDATTTVQRVSLKSIAGLGVLLYVLAGFGAVVGLAGDIGNHRWKRIPVEIGFVLLAPVLAVAFFRIARKRAQNPLVGWAVAGVVLLVALVAFVMLYSLTTDVVSIPSYRD